MTKLREMHRNALVDVKKESKNKKDMALNKQRRGDL